MENEFILVSERLPQKGKHIIALDSENNQIFCFRCTCQKEDCFILRNSMDGYAIIERPIIKWKYDLS